MVELTESPIDQVALTAPFCSNLAGAVCTSLGTVREMTDGRRTASLDYEAYPEMAVAKLVELEAEARRLWPVIETAIAHRVGRLGPGEVSVIVAASCPHRNKAFAVCRWLIDTIKEVVQIWKKELRADSTEEWVRPNRG